MIILIRHADYTNLCVVNGMSGLSPNPHKQDIIFFARGTVRHRQWVMKYFVVCREIKTKHMTALVRRRA